LLRSLAIRNYALIETVDIEFSCGLNVITGQSGAGKSIMVEALGLILGRKAARGDIGPWGKKTEIIATFTVTSEIEKWLTAAELDPADELHLRRTVSLKDSRAYLNGNPLPLGQLQQLARLLLDIHGQHEHQSLLYADNYIALLDNYGGHSAELAIFQECHADYKTAEQKYQSFKTSAQANDQMLDLYRFQLNEIDQAALVDGEEEDLRDEREQLRHAEEINQALLGGAAHLGDDGGVLEQVGVIVGDLDRVRKKYPRALEWYEELLKLEAVTQDIYRAMRDAGEQVIADPARLEKVESRLYLIEQLQKKYGASITSILAYYDEIDDKVKAAANYDDDLAVLHAAVAKQQQQTDKAAAKLTKARTKATGKLGRAVKKELLGLGLEKSSFTVELVPLASGWDMHGAEKVEMLFTANPGHTAQPLAKVASGGEISRVMLALKRVLAESSPVAAMVFDEIDSGISGPVASRVADRLSEVSKIRQTICITHLPVIAAIGDTHFQVAKEEAKGRTNTKIKKLSKPERIDEVAMLFSREITPASRQHARQLLAPK